MATNKKTGLTISAIDAQLAEIATEIPLARARVEVLLELREGLSRYREMALRPRLSPTPWDTAVGWPRVTAGVGR